MINGVFTFQWYLWQHKAVVRLVKPNSSWISTYVIACDGPPLTSTSPHQSSPAVRSSGKLVYQRSHPTTPHPPLPPPPPPPLSLPIQSGLGLQCFFSSYFWPTQGSRGKVGARAEPIHYSSCFFRWQPDDKILLRAPSIQHWDYTRALSSSTHHHQPLSPHQKPYTCIEGPTTTVAASPLQLILPVFFLFLLFLDFSPCNQKRMLSKKINRNMEPDKKTGRKAWRKMRPDTSALTWFLFGCGQT